MNCAIYSRYIHSFRTDFSIVKLFCFLRYLITFISVFILSCSPAFYLQQFPELSEQVYYRKVIQSESVLNNDEAYRTALRLRTQYSYAFLIEKADRLILDDYSVGEAIFNKALVSFETAIDHGEKSLKIRYPELKFNDYQIISNTHFVKTDIEILYWLAAAYGGAVSASRGAAEWVIQLPKIGILLDQALALDPEWNFGAIHTAMISYSMVRTDLNGQNIEEAKKHYTEALRLSNDQDAGAWVAYAEKICVPVQNKEEFIETLNRALQINNVENEALQLGNIIAQNRAKWLLSRKEELFY